MDDYLGYLIFGPLFLLGVGLLLYAQIGAFKGFFIQCGWICLQIAGIAVGTGVVIEGARLIGVTPYIADLEWKPVKWASVIVGVLAALVATLIVNWLLERRRAKREQLSTDTRSPDRGGE